jgi:hypothetical protein
MDIDDHSVPPLDDAELEGIASKWRKALAGC